MAIFKPLRFLIAAMPSLAAAADVSHPAVLELFTSQGCSSCPAADKLVGGYADRSDVLVLSFHVSYWNDLGWVDPYSSDAFSERQSDYKRYLHRQGMYTPQAIVQGQYNAMGSDAQKINSALVSAQRSAPWVMPLLDVHGDTVRVRVPAGEGTADVLLVGFMQASGNAVPNGENAGRTLTHRHNVTTLESLGRWNGKAFAATHAKPKGDGVAILLQAPDSGAIIGAAWL